MLEKNLYPSNLIDQQVKQYLHAQCTDKKTKKLVILHMFHITNWLILEICRQKLNRKLSNILSIILKVLLSKLYFPRLKLEIYLVLKDHCLSI